MNKLTIEYLSPTELTPYENNTRKHTPDDIEGIKKSILADGFNDPRRSRAADRSVRAWFRGSSCYPARSYDRGTAQGIRYSS